MYQGILGEISPTCMLVTLVILLFKHKSLQQLGEREREEDTICTPNACVILSTCRENEEENKASYLTQEKYKNEKKRTNLFQGLQKPK